MDENAKKSALRMIPYGLYILTAESDNDIAASTVNWVTQTSFQPPLIAVGVKVDSNSYRLIKEVRKFALNMLGKGQADLAYTFFKPTVKEDGKISGQSYKSGETGSPIILSAVAFVECTVSDIVEKGDHATVIGEVVNAGMNMDVEGRLDDAILWLKDLGEKVFYGG